MQSKLKQLKENFTVVDNKKRKHNIAAVHFYIGKVWSGTYQHFHYINFKYIGHIMNLQSIPKRKEIIIRVLNNDINHLRAS